ncbi:hypothetical protein HA46_16960 [Pantoea septica]|uniref:Fimbrial-type adhesion domain-containing protein n=2 Tax=Erwiniaceae TaxID=1903409 RepID=A0ABX3UNG2_9GAMM|nr:hypothetical protein HA46_16960 [Pantoea septica]
MRRSTILVTAAWLSLLSSHALGYDTLIRVTGSVRVNSCVVAADSINLNVPMGTVQASDLYAPDSQRPQTPFVLNLENCGVAFSGAKIRFTAQKDENDPTLIRIDPSGATGVGIQLLDEEGNRLAVGEQTAAKGRAGDDRVAINFFARLAATGAPLKAGPVSASVVWNVEYQ